MSAATKSRAKQRQCLDDRASARIALKAAAGIVIPDDLAEQLDHNWQELLLVIREDGSDEWLARLHTMVPDRWEAYRDALEWARENPADSPENPGQANPGDSSFSSFVRNPSPESDPESVEVRRWPDPLQGEAFHGLPGAIVRAIEATTEADPAGLLVNVLVMVGNAIGRGPRVMMGTDPQHGNEFAVTVGDSYSGRKGTTTRDTTPVVKFADEDWFRLRRKSGLVSGEGLVYHVRDEVTEENEKGEKVVKDKGESDKRLLAYESEFADVLRVLSREGNKLSGVLRQAWDGDTLGSLAKNEPMTATGAHVSLLGHVTEEDLVKYLTKTDAANGLANRFLWVAVRRCKIIPPLGQPRPDLDAVKGRLADALGWVRLQIWDRPIGWSQEAQDAFNAGYIESQSRYIGGLLGKVINRREAHIARLALIYAVLDRRYEVDIEHVLAATAVWDYCSASAAYIFADRLGDPHAEKALAAIREAGPDGLTKTQILKDVFCKNISAAALAEILAALERQGLARRERQKNTGGRPAEAWFPTGNGTTNERTKRTNPPSDAPGAGGGA